jgi:Tyrosine phosphatase family
MPDGQATPGRRRSLLALLPWGGLAGFVLVLAIELSYTLVGSNFREVAPGLIYRCAKLSTPGLERVIRQHHIHTVINLCGCCDPVPWYLEQARTLSRLDVSMEDLGCSASRLPSTHTVRELVKILDHTEYPILVHCHRGIDRTGLVVVVALLLHSDIGLDEALGQLSWRYAHISFAKTGNMDRFFELYREWLNAAGLRHSRAVFRRWLEVEYCPGECRARYQVVGIPPDGLIHLPQGTPSPILVRCTNTSVKPWYFKPGANAGIHMQYIIDEIHGAYVHASRTGLLYATVPPGESIELTIPAPSLDPGRYHLRADLIDEQHASFFQVGSEPLYLEIEVK